MHDPTMYASGVFTGIILCLLLPAIVWVCLSVADLNPWLEIGRIIRKLSDRMNTRGLTIQHDHQANRPGGTAMVAKP
jgi:hypothetical protein